MELHFKSRAYAAVITTVLLLCFYGSPPPLAPVNAASRSVRQPEVDSRETPPEQHLESGVETAVFNDGAYGRQNEPVWRQPAEGSNLFDVQYGWSGGGVAAGERSKAAPTLPSARAKIMTGASVPSAVRTRTQEEEGNEFASTTEVPVTTWKAHRTPEGHPWQQLMLNQEQSDDRAVSTQGVETYTMKKMRHRPGGRRLPRRYVARPERDTTAESPNTPIWLDDFLAQYRQEGKEEERDARSASPMRRSSAFSGSPDVHQTFEYGQQQQPAQQAHNLSDEKALMAEGLTDVLTKIKAGGFQLASSAEEDEGVNQVMLEPQTTKMEVLFRSTDLLGVRYTATGSVVCTNGGVYGFATSAGPGEQQAAEGGSSPRVRLKRDPADVVVLVGEAGSAAAAENSTLEVPFSSSLSESAAAASSRKNSRLVLLCTAPGQPVVALPAKDVNVIQENAFAKKEEDLRERVACLREAAAWRRAERHVEWMRRVSRIGLMISIAAFVGSMVTLTWRIGVQAHRHAELFTRVSVKNPTAIARFLRDEDALRQTLLNSQIPQRVIDSLPDRPNSTLPELRAVRRSVFSVARRTRVVGYMIAAHVLLALLNKGITLNRKRMNRKRKLVLQGLSLEQADAISAFEEKVEEQDTVKGHRSLHQALTSVAGKLRYGPGGVYGYMQETPGVGDDNMRQWQTPYSTVLHREQYQPPSARATDTEEDPFEKEDRSFFQAVHNVEDHWNAAALLTPDQLEQHNLVLVVPNDVTSQSPQGRTRLLIVYGEGQEQTPNSASDEPYGIHEQQLEQAVLPQRQTGAEHNKHEWL